METICVKRIWLLWDKGVVRPKKQSCNKSVTHICPTIRQYANHMRLTHMIFICLGFCPQCQTYRHLNIVQIFGTAKSGNIHATILYAGVTFGQKQFPQLMFDSELIPLDDFLYLHRRSPFATVYIHLHIV
jgi:hypothetical protein